MSHVHTFLVSKCPQIFSHANHSNICSPLIKDVCRRLLQPKNPVPRGKQVGPNLWFLSFLFGIPVKRSETTPVISSGRDIQQTNRVGQDPAFPLASFASTPWTGVAAAHPPKRKKMLSRANRSQARKSVEENFIWLEKFLRA